LEARIVELEGRIAAMKNENWKALWEFRNFGLNKMFEPCSR
jgi:hypothetical protein